MKQFVIHHLTNRAQQLGQTVVHSPPGSAADLLIALPGGQQVAIYVINYGIRSADLDEQLSANTRHSVFSLYILDGRMLPEDGAVVEPPHWMSALHDALEGRIYGYWCSGRAVTIRPVHFEWRWGDERRRVVYGPPVNWGQVRPAYVQSGVIPMPGGRVSIHGANGRSARRLLAARARPAPMRNSTVIMARWGMMTHASGANSAQDSVNAGAASVPPRRLQ